MKAAITTAESEPAPTMLPVTNEMGDIALDAIW